METHHIVEWRPCRHALAILVSLLQACGGGGGSEVAPVVQSSGTVLSGQVIYDAPVAKAKVSVRDAEGQSWSAETDAEGKYRIELPTDTKIKPPLLVRAEGVGRRWEIGNGATLGTETVQTGVLSPAIVPVKIDPAKGLDTPVLLYAVSNTAGVAHVTPATTLVVNRLTAQRAEAAYVNLGKAGTTIGDALAPGLVSAAQAAVKQTLAQAGLPAALLDDPTSPSLVPVDLSSTYQKLVSGDILSAIGTLLNAIVDNQINFGCSGEGYGIMLDDGLSRPSCLAGANVAQSWLLTSFIGLESARSLDIETRADELAGVGGPGGGWKYQSERLPPPERRARVQGKLLAALKGMDATTSLSGPATQVIAILRTWDDNTWHNLNTKICSSINVADLSDLTYSYQELKLSMKPGVATPTEDAASFLSFSGSSIKSTAVNRILPRSFEDGSRTNSCPIVEKNASRLRELVAAYQPAPYRPALTPLLVDLEDGLTAWLKYPVAERMTNTEVLNFLFSPIFMIGAYYDFPPLDFLNNGSAVGRLIESNRLCFGYGNNSQECRAAMYTPEQFRAEVANWAGSLTPEQTAAKEEQADVTLANLGSELAQFYMDEYEQHFDKYFVALTSFTIAEAQGYVVNRWQLENPERDASIAVPDVSQVGYKVNGSSIELTGQFLVRRFDVRLPKFTTDKLLSVIDGLRLVPVKVSLDQLPAVAMCDSNDLACMGRLRRTRKFTQVDLSLDVSGSVSLWFATSSYWQTYLNSMQAHNEVLQFDRGYAEMSFTLKGN
ncbi:carboxypeptidase-like regulatory domain-containing protein [Janthinobacterium sp. HLX7-2]|uniref:carboxypeptidase-like regulatory domain-containing protein n=1 Tax=Janthinobacterium sp. HLX7-2 TaxID=1259331 RepID=UPI003F1EB057